jgi:hypothetical protein
VGIVQVDTGLEGIAGDIQAVVPDEEDIGLVVVDKQATEDIVLVAVGRPAVADMQAAGGIAAGPGTTMGKQAVEGRLAVEDRLAIVGKLAVVGTLAADYMRAIEHMPTVALVEATTTPAATPSFVVASSAMASPLGPVLASKLALAGEPFAVVPFVVVPFAGVPLAVVPFAGVPLAVERLLLQDEPRLVFSPPLPILLLHPGYT